MDLNEIRDAVSVLQRASVFLPDDGTPQNVLSALSDLVNAAQQLLASEQKSKALCLVRSLRVKRAHKHNGRVGGVLLPNLLKAGEETRGMLLKPQKCYVCKESYRELHYFYDAMCKKCGDFNYTKRFQTGDLTGQRALVTGGRIKIGFEIARKLLDAGAHVIVTTRFPKDAEKRYRSHPDWDKWGDRLTIMQMDLLNTKHIARVCEAVFKHPLHILINNAAQTIARPEIFYRSLLSGDEDSDHKEGLHLVEASSTDWRFFPKNEVDENGIQADLRPENTWITPLEKTPFQELLHVTAINYIGPFVLMEALHPALSRAEPRAFVVNVSAMEGNYRCHKTGYHVHTNGAKAALNMITRTVGRIWADQAIYVTSVDTGWVTNEYPVHDGDTDDKFHPPLDEVDGAARVLDPIFAAGVNPSYGIFLKDYKPRAW